MPNATALAFAGAARKAELVRSREVSLRELVELCLARIVQLDPELNAFRVVMAERALAEADEVDARRASAAGERPLLGVPVAVKDDQDVSGEATEHGTAATGGPVGADSELVGAAQLVGRLNDEGTLLSLPAQVGAERPWADRRPAS